MDESHFAHAGEQLVPLLEQLMDRAHAEGTLRPDVGFADFTIVMAMLTDLARHSADCRADLYERYLQLIIDGLRARPDNGELGPAPSDADVRAVLRECVPPLEARRR